MRESPINWSRKHCASCTVHEDARGVTGRSPKPSKLCTRAGTELGARNLPHTPRPARRSTSFLHDPQAGDISGLPWSCYSTPQWDRSTQHPAKSQGSLQRLSLLPQILPGERFQLTSLCFVNTILLPATPTALMLELFANYT